MTRGLRHLGIMLFFLAAMAWSACDDGGQVTAGDPAADETLIDDPIVDEDPTLDPPPVDAKACGFDPALVGRDIGDHVANFSLKDQDNQLYDLHQHCGTDKKAIWIVLAAGW